MLFDAGSVIEADVSMSNEFSTLSLPPKGTDSAGSREAENVANSNPAQPGTWFTVSVILRPRSVNTYLCDTYRGNVHEGRT